MKKIFRLMACLMMASAMISLSSCTGAEEEEIMGDEDITNYTEMIVGYWQLQGKREYWRFDGDGSGTITDKSHGDNWDEADDIYEDEETSNFFEWYFEKNGLMIIYRNNGYYNTPEPDAPFIVNSITEKVMTWTTNNGKGTTQKFVRSSRH